MPDLPRMWWPHISSFPEGVGIIDFADCVQAAGYNSSMRVEITEKPFDPWRTLSEYRPCEAKQNSAARAGEFGAVSTFVGKMRDFNHGDEVKVMRIVHYPEMTRAHIEQTIEQVMVEHAVGDALVIHRVGDVLPGETIVLVAVWAVHRRDAYAANRCIMEDLKTRVPFWKQESLTDSTRWVEQNTPGE